MEIIAGLSLLPLSLLYQLLSHCWGEHGQRPLKRNKIVKKGQSYPFFYFLSLWQDLVLYVILYSLREVFGFFSYFTIPLYSVLSLKNVVQDSVLLVLLAPRTLAPFCLRWKPNTSSPAAGVCPVESLESLSVHLSKHQSDRESIFSPQPSPAICLPCSPSTSIPLKIAWRSLASPARTTPPSQPKFELAHMVGVKLRSSSQKCFVKFFSRRAFSSKIVSPCLLFCLASLSFIFLVGLKCRHSLLADVVWDSYILFMPLFQGFHHIFSFS